MRQYLYTWKYIFECISVSPFMCYAQFVHYGTLPWLTTVHLSCTGTREFAACNHMRAVHFFTESINSVCPFEGYRCASEEDFNVSLFTIKSVFKTPLNVMSPSNLIFFVFPATQSDIVDWRSGLDQFCFVLHETAALELIHLKYWTITCQDASKISSILSVLFHIYIPVFLFIRHYTYHCR